jgi:hypothetical protein
MPVLHIRLPGREPMRYEMTADEATIGRGRECSVVIAGDQGVSRVHCRISKSGNRFVVTDAGSANGTRLNGRDIGRSPAELLDGDKISVGATEIVFDDPLSPRRSWLGKLVEAVTGPKGKAGKEGLSGPKSGTVYGDGFIVCGKCGARINTTGRAPGQKVGCGRCRSMYVIPRK